LKTKISTKKGFLIVEALMAITILIMTVASSIYLVVWGFQAVNFNKNSMVAGMLVQECEQSLRGLRDTNWLRFSYDKTNCWNSNSNACPAPEVFQNEYYRLEMPLTDAPNFKISTFKAPLDLSDGVDPADNFFLLYYTDMDPAVDSDGDGDKTNDKEGFVNDAGIEPSKFYRMMQIISIDAIPATITNAKCVVGWMEGNDPKKIELPIIITNY
jgi:hypothetical protein